MTCNLAPFTIPEVLASANQIDSKENRSGPLRPCSPAVFESVSDSVYSQSDSFGESAHSDSLPGAVEVNPNISPIADSTVLMVLPVLADLADHSCCSLDLPGGFHAGLEFYLDDGPALLFLPACPDADDPEAGVMDGFVAWDGGSTSGLNP
ncbi:hypothetical protein Nepgr_027735 [Nepenthes gracilis]|uniref:Uncharacterized protein n=1 Tax=Nepenthes gracilis TaxID=150966 RepID=A0AAD3TC90_NEPGR|nr:hypothetical protein Nepgr_027735 [Nepenthes gracilis]